MSHDSGACRFVGRWSSASCPAPPPDTASPAVLPLVGAWARHDKLQPRRERVVCVRCGSFENMRTTLVRQKVSQKVRRNNNRALSICRVGTSTTRVHLRFLQLKLSPAPSRAPPPAGSAPQLQAGGKGAQAVVPVGWERCLLDSLSIKSVKAKNGHRPLSGARTSAHSALRCRE